MAPPSARAAITRARSGVTRWPWVSPRRQPARWPGASSAEGALIAMRSTAPVGLSV